MGLARLQGMRQRLFVVAVLTALLSITGINAQRPAPSLTHAGSPTSVVRLDRFDQSPRLRDLPPGLPPIGEMIKEREPRWRRVSRHPSGLLSDPVVQNTPSLPSIPGPSRSIEGIGNMNAVLPPDTTGDVGPNHFVQWVNLSFAVYSKGSGTTPPALLYGPAAANTLWAGFGGPCETRNDGDPIVRYDHLADRWVMSQLAIPNNFLGILLFGPFYECIAVSATSDPLGAYYRYQYLLRQAERLPEDGCVARRLLHDDESVHVAFAAMGRAGRRGVRSREDAGRTAGRSDLLRPRIGRHESCRDASGRSRWSRAAGRLACLFCAGGRRRVGSDRDRPGADLAVPYRLDDSVSVFLFACGRLADRSLRFRHVRQFPQLHCAARDDRNRRRDIRSPDVSAAVPKFRRSRIARRESHRRRGWRRPRGHPVVRNQESRVVARHLSAGHLRTRYE